MATALARLGLRTSLAAAFGDDMYGDYCREALEKGEGIDLALSHTVPGWHSPVTVSMAYEGERTMISHGHEAPAREAATVAHCPRPGRGAPGERRPRDPRLPAPGPRLRDLPRPRVTDRSGSPPPPPAAAASSPTSAGTSPVAGTSRPCRTWPTARRSCPTRRKPCATPAPTARARRPAPSASGCPSPSSPSARRAATRWTPVRARARTSPPSPSRHWTRRVRETSSSPGFVVASLAGWPLADRLAFAGLTAALSVQEFGGSLSAPGWPEIAAWWRRPGRGPEGTGTYTFLDAVLTAAVPGAAAPCGTDDRLRPQQDTDRQGRFHRHAGEPPPSLPDTGPWRRVRALLTGRPASKSVLACQWCDVFLKANHRRQDRREKG